MKIYYWLIIFLFIPFLAQAQTEAMDTDQDGLSDEQELNIYFTDPLLADTDGDGFNDGDEIKGAYSPLVGNKKKLSQVDSDKDYLNDAWELILGTGLMNPDSDGDKYLDGTEVMASYDPLQVGEVKVEKLIKVSLAKQKLEYFFGDKLFGSFPISSGVKSMPSPVGEFKILDKVPVKYYGGADYSYPNTKWNLHFYTKKYRYYIHGAYWHNNFGKPMSHGCINVSYENMENLYNWAQFGTKVIIE